MLMTEINSNARCCPNSAPSRVGRMPRKPLEDHQKQDAERLNALFKTHTKLSQQRFGETYGIGSQPLVWQYLSGHIPLNLAVAIKFADGLGVSVAEFSPTLAEKMPRNKRYEPSKAVVITAREKSQTDAIDVPVFEVTASMGLGLAMPDHETVVDHLRLTREWVGRNLPSASGVGNLAVISAYGDSMSPTFNDGDILLVDRGVSTIKLDAVYVLAFHNELYIKRIQRRPDGSIAIISDNRVYDPIIVGNDAKDSIQVLGRVLWSWNGRKL